MSQICLCWIVDSSPWAASIFRMCSIWYKFPNIKRNQNIVFSKMSRRTRRFRYYPFQSSNPWLFDWSGSSSPISWSPWATYSCSGDFRIAQLIVELSLFDLSQLVQQLNVGCQGFENLYNIHCHWFPCADLSHDHRMFSILEHVHPSERVGSSAQVLRVVTWVTRIFCSKVLPLFSCKPLCRYKSLVVCLKEWLRAIEFDRIAIPFTEQAVNCTRKLCCEEISMFVCSMRFWVYSDRTQRLFDQVERQSGFTAVKNTDCLCFLLLRPPGINPLWTMECIS